MDRIGQSTQRMAGLIQSHDWSATPLGLPHAWPDSLSLLISVMLGSQQPMFVIWGHEHRLIYNDSYAEILAAKHPAALGRPFYDVWHEIRNDLVPIVDKAASGEPVFMDDIELIMQRKGYAEETHFSFSYTPIRQPGGAVVGIFCPCVETTELVMSQRRLREREREISEALEVQKDLLAQKDMLLAEVNHRVKNSLQLVVSSLSLQSRRLKDPATKTAFEQAITRVRAITSVHERLYKSENPLVVDMPSYLRGLADDLAGPSELRGRMLVEVDDIHLLTERAIPIALIVNELVTNALKYAYPEGAAGPIRLRLKRMETGNIVLSVSDEGTGMSSTTTAGGLGTRLIDTMASQLDGTIDRQVTDDGYRVAITFPADQGVMSLRVLIVEDELLLAMDLEDILVEAGHSVVGNAVDMHQAVAICEKFPGAIDIAIMDVHLARGTNGVETAAILRQRWDIPSLFVSGNIDEKMRAVALEWKPAGFVGKPFSERAVLDVLTTVVEARKVA